MKNIMYVCALALLLNPLPALRGETLNLDFEPTLNSKYVWRGITFSGESVFQPSVSASYGRLSFNLWGNLNLVDNDDYDIELNEIDYTISYSVLSGPVDFALGGVLYTFPNIGDGATTELFASIGLPSRLNPSFTVYQDVQEAEGTYLSLGIAPSIPLDNWNTSLDLALSMGIGSSKHNTFYYGASGGGATDFLLGLGMPFQLSDNTTLTPHIALASLLGKDIRASQARDSAVLVGFGLSSSF